MRFTSAEGASGNRPLGWIGVVNLANVVQTVTVTLIPEVGEPKTVTRQIAPMKRTSIETHSVLPQGAPFGTVIECEVDCVASLVLWDKLVRDPLAPALFVSHQCVPVPEVNPYTVHR